MPSMTRNRGGAGETLRASTYQYAAKYLLFNEEWLGHSLADATQTIAGLLPPGLSQAWRLINTKVHDAEEDLLLPLAHWLSVEGPGYGLRTPNTSERAKALGLEQHFAAMNLPDRDLYNAQGNVFDKDALATCIAGHVDRWVRHNMASAPPPIPAPRVLLQWFRAGNCNRLKAMGGVPSPLPPDIDELTLSDIKHAQLCPAADLRAPKRSKRSDFANAAMTTSARERPHYPPCRPACMDWARGRLPRPCWCGPRQRRHRLLHFRFPASAPRGHGALR